MLAPASYEVQRSVLLHCCVCHTLLLRLCSQMLDPSHFLHFRGCEEMHEKYGNFTPQSPGIQTSPISHPHHPVVAFFHAPRAISAIGSADERIVVGCNSGEVLQLRAHLLV